jgi:hypothetical protein
MRAQEGICPQAFPRDHEKCAQTSLIQSRLEDEQKGMRLVEQREDGKKCRESAYTEQVLPVNP